MNKLLIGALVLSGGVATQALATDTKVGLLNISLANRFQALTVGSKPGVYINPSFQGRNWTTYSYEYLYRCMGTVTYTSATLQINNTEIIKRINAGLSGFDKVTGLFNTPPVAGSLDPNPYYGGKFTTSGSYPAKLIVVRELNNQKLPPYPITIDQFYGTALEQPAWTIPTDGIEAWNAPYNLSDLPSAGLDDGTRLAMTWPNLRYITWGKPVVDAQGLWSWAGARVFVVDPANTNPNLRCFDVTPFFAFEENYCMFCWDTLNRVTDGVIQKNSTVSDPPCNWGGVSCGVKGSGTTKFYFVVKFNNVAAPWQKEPNTLLAKYYERELMFLPEWANTYGTKLSDADTTGSKNALVFSVDGLATYTWKFATLSDGFTWPMGKITAAAVAGHGYSPMCGIFSGSVTLTDYDRAGTSFRKYNTCP